MSATAWLEEVKSGQGLSRHLIERGPSLLVAALLIALALDSALILTRALNVGNSTSSIGAARNAPAHRNVNPTLELARIVNAHLFGASAVSASGVDAPQTTMPLILAGVIADQDPSKGQAIIGPNAAAAKLYAVGAMIGGGARLHAVYDNRVLIERNGALEALMLPRTPLAGAIGPTPPSAAIQRPATAFENANLLSGLVRLQPVFEQNKLSGYRIFPGGARGANTFRQLGLRSGDLIVAVNGTTLDDPARAMDVMQTLSSSGSATVTVSRNGQSQEVNLNLATIAQEADAAGSEGPATVTPAPAQPQFGPRSRAFGPGAPPPGAVATGDGSDAAGAKGTSSNAAPANPGAETNNGRER